MQNPKELANAIERINQSTNFLAQEVIEIRDQIVSARAGLSEQESQTISDRLTRVAKVLEQIGNDPNDPAPRDLPTE
jgi:uncharacterized protein (UPF0147 family)